jgi:hypothetical protein
VLAWSILLGWSLRARDIAPPPEPFDMPRKFMTGDPSVRQRKGRAHPSVGCVAMVCERRKGTLRGLRAESFFFI